MSNHQLIEADEGIITMAKNSNGSILVFTLMIVMLVIAVSEQLIRTRIIGSAFSQTMLQKEQAKLLALSGINYARALLEVDTEPSEKSPDEKEKSTDPEKKEDTWQQKLLHKLLPHFHRWNTFELTEEEDGIEGTIKLCISPESGKININEAFDFKQGTFKKEYDSLLKGLAISGHLAPGKIYEALTEYLKGRKRKLDDISELCAIDALRTLDIFYDPPHMPTGKDPSEPNFTIKLADLFTTWGKNEQINPLFLSDSLCAVLSLRRPHADDALAKKEDFDTLISNFNDAGGEIGDEEWTAMQPLYEEKPKVLEEIKRLFSKQFGTPIYSVLSCGKIGDVEQRVLAILRQEKKKLPEEKKTGKESATPSDKDKQDNKQDDKTSRDSKKSSKIIYKVVKVYYL